MNFARVEDEVGVMAKCLMDNVDLSIKVEEFFDLYFSFEEAVKLSEWIDYGEWFEMSAPFMTEDGYDELLDCIDEMEEKIPVMLAEIKALLGR